MRHHFRPAFILLVAFSLLTGIVYPLVITAVAQVLFPVTANGSAVMRDGQVVGSRLIGQSFTRPEYFWGRPSAAGAGYDARASSGSNFGPSARALAERIAADATRYGVPAAHVPIDLLTASGSGLDPDISPAAARFQIPRVAAARRLPEADVARLVDAATAVPELAPLGAPRVNVLALNLALDAFQRAAAR